MRMCAIFGTKTSHLSWAKNFWYKPLLLLSSTYGPFQSAKFKKNLTMDPELWRCTIFRPKVVCLPQMIFFFRKLVNEPFLHAYLHAKNRSQILIYYWNTNNLRILKFPWLRTIFAFTLELDFSKHAVFSGS